MKETAKKFKVEMTIYLDNDSDYEEVDIFDIVTRILNVEGFPYDCEVTEIIDDTPIRPEVSE